MSSAAAAAAQADGVALPSPKKADGGDPTAPAFGDVWKQIQAQYGEKPKQQREIKKTLGKDDFLRIMITQMKHQDPTQPFKAEQFASELAQYASVEQLSNMNTNIAKMADRNQPLERLAMTNLIGKSVTIDRERFQHVDNQNSTVNFTLPRDAASVRVSIVGENGEAMLEKDLGPQKAGENTFVWDGKKSNTLPANGGTYMLRVVASDDKGVSMQINTKGQARVVGVSFEGTEPVFLVGDPNKPDKVMMRNISRIENDGAALPVVPGAQSLAAASRAPDAPAEEPAQAPMPPRPQQSFVAFRKGVGSSNVDADTAAKLQEAIKPEEKGFPNGLQQESDAEPDATIQKGGEKR
jgi:flagellar basal-body rod modification protein FlgD